MVARTVLLVEDDEHTRARLARAVASHPELAVFASVGTCADAREALARTFPDVMLVDLGLPDGSGIDLIREVRSANAPTEVMVITVFGDEKHVIAAIEAGATGYLLKDGSSDYIGSSIMQMLNGGSPISASIARWLLKRFQSQVGSSGHAPAKTALTPREQETLNYLAKGFSYSEIAEMLGMSVHTVTTHIRHIYRKLEVRSRAEAVFEAAQLGLVKFDS